MKPKKAKPEATEPPIAEKLEGISLAIHGDMFARPEMRWAIEMGLAATKDGTADARLEEAWRSASLRRLKPVFWELCRAVAERRPETFKALAKCVEAMKSRGNNWAIGCPSKVIQWTHNHPGRPLNITQLCREHGYDPKTVRLWARKMGVPITRRGNPGQIGKRK